MNDNEGTVPQQVAHLEAMAATMREDLAEARVGLLAKPDDERLTKHLSTPRFAWVKTWKEYWPAS